MLSIYVFSITFIQVYFATDHWKKQKIKNPTVMILPKENLRLQREAYLLIINHTTKF